MRVIGIGNPLRGDDAIGLLVPSAVLLAALSAYAGYRIGAGQATLVFEGLRILLFFAPWLGGFGSFRVSEPSLDHFPFPIWSRLVARHSRGEPRRAATTGRNAKD